MERGLDNKTQQDVGWEKGMGPTHASVSKICFDALREALREWKNP